MEMREEILKTFEEQVDPKHVALIIADAQKDFLASDGAMAKDLGIDVSRMQNAVPRLNRFIHAARRVGIMIVWTKGIIVTDRSMPNYRLQWGEGSNIKVVRCGTDGVEFYSGMTQPLSTEYVITKWNYDAFENTDLDLLLRSNGIKTLLLTGFGTNVCVESTARHGFTRGYYIVLVSDCTDTITQQEYEATIFNIKNYFGIVASSEEIMKAWGLDVSQLHHI
jgi:nicotinamidase-related amidase